MILRVPEWVSKTVTFNLLVDTIVVLSISIFQKKGLALPSKTNDVPITSLNQITQVLREVVSK
jgi:hypothetical protein